MLKKNTRPLVCFRQVVRNNNRAVSRLRLTSESAVGRRSGWRGGLSPLLSPLRRAVAGQSSVVCSRNSCACLHFTLFSQSSRCRCSNNLCATLYYLSSDPWILVLFVWDYLVCRFSVYSFGCGKSCSLISVVCFVLLRSVFWGLLKVIFSVLTFSILFRDCKGGKTTINNCVLNNNQIIADVGYF